MTAALRGFKELDAALSELPKSTAKNVLRRVGRKALQPMLAASKAAAPKDDGDLVASITIKNSKAKRQRGQVKFDPATGVSLDMGPTGRPAGGNAAWQEFGTVKQPAQPYQRPAWESEKEPTLDRIRADMGKEIDKAAARLARKAGK